MRICSKNISYLALVFPQWQMLRQDFSPCLVLQVAGSSMVIVLGFCRGIMYNHVRGFSGWLTGSETEEPTMPFCALENWKV